MAFWAKDKRRDNEELIDKKVSLVLTNSERDWIVIQAREECTSQNSIIRKCIKLYKKKVDSE